jgi:single-stranded-DNA-specific exonuclease
MLVEEVKRTGMDYGIFERLEQAWAWWQEWVPQPARVRIVGDDDSDGMTSAYIVGEVLKRAGYEVDVLAKPLHSPEDVDVAFKEARDGYVVLDSGSAVIEHIDSFGIPTLILDHHRVHDNKPQNTFEVNPRMAAGDKVQHVSTSVLAGLFAVTVGDHWDLSFAGVAGGISDRQHLGGFKGLIGYLADGGMKNGVLNTSAGFTLVGATIEEAILESLDPFFDHYSGKPEAVRTLLSRHGINGKDSPVTLTGDKGMRLAKDLTQSLNARGVVTERMYPLYDERYLLRQHASGASTVFQIAQWMEAATADGENELALRCLAGDPRAAAQIKQMQKKRVQAVLAETERLRNNTKELPNLRYCETRDGANTGVYAHTLLTFIFGDDKPFIVLSRLDDLAKCSSRGSPRLYGAGVDLSIGMGQAAQAVGGHGGGHPGASGATVPYAKREEFLTRLNEVLGRLRRGPA